METELTREAFLSLLPDFDGTGYFAVALVAGDAVTEEQALSGWVAFQARLDGTGARIGFKSFVAVVRCSPEALEAAALALRSWAVVATRISNHLTVEAVREVEWRAHKTAERDPGTFTMLVNVA